MNLWQPSEYYDFIVSVQIQVARVNCSIPVTVNVGKTPALHTLDRSVRCHCHQTSQQKHTTWTTLNILTRADINIGTHVCS